LSDCFDFSLSLDFSPPLVVQTVFLPDCCCEGFELCALAESVGVLQPGALSIFLPCVYVCSSAPPVEESCGDLLDFGVGVGFTVVVLGWLSCPEGFG
jgi:hypothetical protein